MIEFIKETHTYLVDGVLTPSATTVLKETIFSNKYANIPQYILDKAAEFGTNVHLAIEINDYLHLNDVEYQVFDKYLKLVKTENIKPIQHELMVNYGFSYAGTLDMIGEVDGVLSLIDVKTTSILDKEYLSWQLSLYEMAYCKMYGSRPFEKFYAIWLPKRGNAKLTEIERKSETEIMELIRLYEDSCKQS